MVHEMNLLQKGGVNMSKDISNTVVDNKEQDFEVLELSDCNVPVGCPSGANPDEDVWPDHW
jgi:hypothetical protein